MRILFGAVAPRTARLTRYNLVWLFVCFQLRGGSFYAVGVMLAWRCVRFFISAVLLRKQHVNHCDNVLGLQTGSKLGNNLADMFFLTLRPSTWVK